MLQASNHQFGQISDSIKKMFRIDDSANILIIRNSIVFKRSLLNFLFGHIFLFFEGILENIGKKILEKKYRMNRIN